MDEPKNTSAPQDIVEPKPSSKKPYEKPRIVEHIPLEAQAGVCDALSNGKADLINCSNLTS